MASKSAQTSITELDPMFFIPEGAHELVYDDEEMDFSNETSEEETESVEYFEDGDWDSTTEDIDFDTQVPTPAILGVLSQTIRRLPNGQQVVDVVVEVEDVAPNYDIKVTKT